MEDNYDDNEVVIGDDDEADLRKSLERARKIAQNKAVPRGPQAIALLASSRQISPAVSIVPQEKNKLVVFTELQDFVSGLRPLSQESRKRKGEDEGPKASVEEHKAEGGGRRKSLQDSCNDQIPSKKKEKNIALDHEVADGKGLFTTLNRIKNRGDLKESGGQMLGPKEAYQKLSHKFHGKGHGKRKQEKRLRKHQEELKLEHMNADAPSLLMENVKKVLSHLKTPYLDLSGNVKPWNAFNA